MSIELDKADQKNASLSLKLRADSGYRADVDGYRVSANQWSAIMAICEGGKQAEAILNAHARYLIDSGKVTA